MINPKQNDPRLPLEALVFDMDGVLIDVSQSYRKTIQKTAQIYLSACLRWDKENIRLSLDEAVSRFKAVGGFNNDWDLTCGLLLCLLPISGFPPCARRKRFASIPETVTHLKKESTQSHRRLPIQISPAPLFDLLTKVKALGGGLKGIRLALRSSWEGWVYGSGDLNRDNLVKRIFQEVYLGQEFNACYSLPRIFYHGNGYYLREKMLIPREILSTLRKRCRLGIASGRPGFEAELALKRFRLRPYFKSVVTLDDSLEEEQRLLRSTGRRVKRSKPHPFPLLQAIHAMGLSRPRCGYVGDVVDDMLAARAAKRKWPLLAIGFAVGARNKEMEEVLRQAGADEVVRHPRELLRLVAPPER